MNHAMLGRMSESGRPSEASRRLLALRDRLASLQSELRQVEEEIGQCVHDLAVATATQPAMLLAPDTPGARILNLLHQQPGRALTPAEIAETLGMVSPRERANVTNQLFRLARAGRAERVDRGRYRAVPQGQPAQRTTSGPRSRRSHSRRVPR
jgi:hypothetical protein